MTKELNTNLDLLTQIKQLISQYPNDMDLGKHVRIAMSENEPTRICLRKKSK